MNRKVVPVRVVFSFEERKNVAGFFEVLIKVERRHSKEAKHGKRKVKSKLRDVGSPVREPILFLQYYWYQFCAKIC